MWPAFEEETIQAAMEPLRTGKVNYWTGTEGMKFEEEFARYNGVFRHRHIQRHQRSHVAVASPVYNVMRSCLHTHLSLLICRLPRQAQFQCLLM